MQITDPELTPLINFFQGNKHKQISDCLRDAQSKRRVQRAELELINQKRDGRIADINSLQLQFEVHRLPCLSNTHTMNTFANSMVDFFYDKNVIYAV